MLSSIADHSIRCIEELLPWNVAAESSENFNLCGLTQKNEPYQTALSSRLRIIQVRQWICHDELL